MERRLRHLALRPVLRIFAGDHALAQQHPGALYRAFFDEVVVLHYQHFANVFRMIQEHDVVPADFVVRDVAVFFCEVLKQEDGIAGTKLPKRKPQQVPLKPGRESVSR